ncbi:MAG: response regulator transcription factor [Actinomycetota bacterium]|nr:response regulator transcription factor [Actinomycetota bacterium]
MEDDVAIRSALEVALVEERYEVCCRSEGTDIERLIDSFRPDLAILDVRLPPGTPNGFDLGRLLRRRSDAPLLFLTAADQIEDRLEGFDVGADDYVVKGDFNMAELLARVRALLRRAGRLASGTTEIGDLELDEGSRTVVRGGAKVDLTRTEFDLLAVLARNPDRVFSKVELLSRVWGFDHYDLNLVEVHMSALRHKLEAHGPRLIHTRRGAGYVFQP